MEITPSPLPNNPAPPMPMQPEGVGYPGGTGNPVLDEISAAHANLSPQAQQAIEGAHGMLGISPSHSDPALAASTAPSPELAVPGVSGPRGPLPILSPEVPAPSRPMAGSAGGTPMADSGGSGVDSALLDGPSVSATGGPLAAPPVSALAQERERLTRPGLPSSDPNAHTSMDTGRTGIGQIHNPWLRGLATAGDVIASGVFPRFGQFIPGTSGYHNNLVAGNERAIQSEEGSAKNAADVAKTGAETAEQLSLPELHKTQAELAAEKIHSTETAKDADRAIKQSEEDRKAQQGQAAIDQHLAASGLKRDEVGNIVPQEYKEMSEPLQAIHDLKSSQQELADSRAALVKAQKDNLPAAQKLAQQRIDNATHASAVAEQRLGLAEKNYELRVGGGSEADAHPGQLLDDNDKTIGTAFQGNVKPTGTERTKGDMANSAAEQLGDIKAIIHKRPDIFGPLSGRETDFTVWLGSQDPDAQAFRAAQTVAADHMAGMFGARSPAVIQQLHDAIGQFKDNPAAALAGIAQVEKATKVFSKAGTPHTSTSAGASSGPTQLDKADSAKAAEQYNALPKGTQFITPDGKAGTKQ